MLVAGTGACSLTDRYALHVILQIALEAQDEGEARRLVAAAGRAAAFVRKAIEEHHATLMAEPPSSLRLGRFGEVVGQEKVEALRLVPMSSRAATFVGKAIE